MRLDAAGHPAQFVWRDATYVVQEVLVGWHLRDRWWENMRDGCGSGASDRHYYRLRCTDGLLCEVYYDAASDYWVLDRVHD